MKNSLNKANISQLLKNKQTAYGPSTEERSGEQTVSDLQGKPRPTNAIVQ